ncbi:UNVERIFIED_CONTAM: hypothetical protein GTU68_038819, partial [Idotea baltica]|nr:hypothetical protein [Idotea baltica]
VEYYLAQIEKQNSTLNAFIDVYNDDALKQAKQLDDKLQNGEALGKLAGLVLGVKDVICQKGKKIKAASKILGDFESVFTATALQRLINEDAIIIGSLNCDEFAMGSSSENSAFGAVKNAQDTERVPGGSSGGSAVAVQADMCLVALGSDTGGSVRQPASFCGVYGVKPTYGRVSRHGLIAYASSFDQIGTLSHNLEDAALITEIMAGSDDFDCTLSKQAVPKFSSELNNTDNKKFKIAYIKQALEHPSLDKTIQAAIFNKFEALKAEGHTVEAVDFPLIEYLVPAYYILTAAEASSNLGRYDGIHFGWRHPEAKTLEVRRRIMLGTFVLSSGYYDAYYTKAQKIRRKVQESTFNILKDFDVIAGPTCPSTAFKLGAKKLQDPTQMYLADIFTVQANLAGVPALSLPLFTHNEDSNMPFGLQLMGRMFDEAGMLQVGKVFEG